MAQADRRDTFDVRKQKIGIVYAKALAAASEKTGQTATLADELDALVGEVLHKHPAFEQALGSVLIGPDEKIAMLDRVFQGRVSEMTLVFLKVLAKHGRLNCLRAVAREFRHQYNLQQGRVEVELRVAHKVSDALKTEITQALRSRLGIEPLLSVVEDPALIAGFIIRVGDTLFDGSVGMQLSRARNEIIEKTVELIQTRREELLLAS